MINVVRPNMVLKERNERPDYLLFNRCGTYVVGFCPSGA